MTTHMDATMQAGLEADGPLVAFAVQVQYPDYTLNLLDGAGTLVVDGQTFVGQDPIYGTLTGLEAWTDGPAAEAPHLNFQIQPPSLTAAAALCSPAAQGSPITVWMCAVSRTTGTVIGTPYCLWIGDLDVATLSASKNARIVKIDAESAWDRFFDIDEGLLLTDGCHQSFWPGELGLEYVTEVQSQIPWGQDVPRPVVVKDIINANGTQDYTNGLSGGYTGGFPGGLPLLGGALGIGALA